MMRPRGAGAWWTAAMALGLLSAGLGVGQRGTITPLGWTAIVLALAAIGCVVMAVRTGRAT